jgi:glucan phosphoethanolaminetransferase (alkaline phosphatase superfamily)
MKEAFQNLGLFFLIGAHPMKFLPKIYCLRVLVAIACALLPVLVQGCFTFIDSGITYYFLWTAVLTAIWLRFRWPIWVFLPAIFVAFAYSGYVITQHDDISYNVISAILDTNIGEVLAYIGNPGVAKSSCMIAVVFGALWWFLCGKWPGRRVTGQIRLHSGIFPLVIVLCAAVYVRTGSAWNKQQMYPANVFTEACHFFREVQFAKFQYARLHYTYAGPNVAHCPRKLTAVMVIGESARAANWSLYGYARPTNPEVAAWMEKSNGRGVVFSDALSAGRLTMNSVPSILSPTTAGNFHDYCLKPSLIRVFRTAGYRTSVLNSHVRASEFWDGTVNLMLKDAALVKKIDRDDQLPAALDKWRTDDPMPRQLAVLHLFGSHYNYGDRYPESYNLFHGGNEMVDAYDNSLAFTDHVLAGIIAEIEDMKEPAVMFYSSDHGENLNDFGDGNIQHSCREFTRYEIEVPMIFYANKAFGDACPRQMEAIWACRNRPVSHDNISQTLLGLAGLTDPLVYLPEYDLSNKAFAPQPRFLINNLRESVAEAVIRATPHGRRATPAAPQSVTTGPDTAAKAPGGGRR